MTKELIGAELDAAVADADGVYWFAGDGRVILTHGSDGPGSVQRYSPSTDWSQGGPIIEREGITVQKMDYVELGRTDWQASTDHFLTTAHAGPTPLIAAMRAYISSKGK